MIMRVGRKFTSPVLEDIETTPEDRAKNCDLLARHAANVEWFNQHAEDIYRDHKGRHVCVAGRELFVGSDPAEVRGRAIAAHPQERGATFRLFITDNDGLTF